MTKTWKSLEDYVRAIAALRWGAPCRAEHINGVDFDGVLRLSDDEIIIVEITEERSLAKVRDDLNKILPTKIRLATEGLICRGYIVIEDEPTSSMKEVGQASHIHVCSAKEFGDQLFDFQTYNALRIKSPFGSAVDSKTGENDLREFVHVNYLDSIRNKLYDVADIAAKLKRGANIVLTGDYGTGKSRCVREVYEVLRNSVREAGRIPLAINLRDHWSSASALEILAGHLGNIGFSNSIDNVIRLLNSGNLILLLDGFDEIGAQVHDTRIDDRKSLRKRALQGVRDLVIRGKTGILLTGRSHFFDSNEEMLESLGLVNQHDATCIEAPEFFSESEGNSYLASLGIKAVVPSWLPRKPLVFQLLVELDPEDVSSLLNREHGKFEFWGTFIYAICKRESKGVGESIAPQSIYLILLQLASKTRYSQSNNGRLSPGDIDSAYQAVIGSMPDQSGRQLLSRMCTLGRIEPESPDRQFLDANVVDILRAEALIGDISAMEDLNGAPQWTQSLRGLGAFHAAHAVSLLDLDRQCFSYLRKNSNSRNSRKLGEVVSILSIFGSETLDFQHLQLAYSSLPFVNLSRRKIKNLIVRESEIGVLLLDGTPISDADLVGFDECIITLVGGISDKAGLPTWIRNCDVITFDRVSNSSRIKESVLPSSQKLFLSIIHKIFFQHGAGREENSLLKGGYGQKFSPKLVDEIIKILLREGVINRRKGDDGWVYQPVRRYTDRMNKIRSELTLSEDVLWIEISALRE